MPISAIFQSSGLALLRGYAKTHILRRIFETELLCRLLLSTISPHPLERLKLFFELLAWNIELGEKADFLLSICFKPWQARKQLRGLVSVEKCFSVSLSCPESCC